MRIKVEVLDRSVSEIVFQTSPRKWRPISVPTISGKQEAQG